MNRHAHSTPRRIRGQLGKLAPLAEPAPATGALRAYTAILSQRGAPVVTLKVTAAVEHIALAEVTRHANYKGTGWRIVVYDGDRLVAVRSPGDARWQRPLAKETLAVRTDGDAT